MHHKMCEYRPLQLSYETEMTVIYILSTWSKFHTAHVCVVMSSCHHNYNGYNGCSIDNIQPGNAGSE